MTKEELIEKAQELTIKNVTDGKSKYYSWGFHKGCVVGLEYNNKHIADLEEKISVLLSCKNCPENKGGFICQKEYEGKCLAQKIQYIKELKEEIKNLKKTYRKQRNKRIDDLQKENTELKKQQLSLKNERNTFLAQNEQYEKDLIDFNEQLTNAKEHILTLISCLIDWVQEGDKDYCHIVEAEQFIKDSEVKK